MDAPSITFLRPSKCPRMALPIRRVVRVVYHGWCDRRDQLDTTVDQPRCMTQTGRLHTQSLQCGCWILRFHQYHTEYDQIWPSDANDWWFKYVYINSSAIQLPKSPCGIVIQIVPYWGWLEKTYDFYQFVSEIRARSAQYRYIWEIGCLLF